MNKILKAIMCTALCGTVAIASAACGCNKDPDPDATQQYDPENRPLFLSIGAVDGNFNPFFYTSLTDGQVVSMTQSALITTEVRKNASGNDEVIPVADDDHPTIAKDFTIKYFTKDGVETLDSKNAKDGGKTEYEFLIKKGMKYADGTEITIKDVLFNFYVYLDPAYTGSNTMYSVDIQGLLAYQENNDLLEDGDGSQAYLDEANADARVERIFNWSYNNEGELGAEGEADIAVVKKLFKEELESDWTSNATSWAVNYETNYNFQHAWEAYLFMEGAISAQKGTRTSNNTTYDLRVDANGNWLDPDTEAYKNGTTLTWLDPWHEKAEADPNNDHWSKTGADHIIKAIQDATTAEKIAQKKADLGCTDEQAYEELTKSWCINDYLYVNKTQDNTIWEVVTQWGTAQTAYRYFVADEHGKRTSGSPNPRHYISGIQTKQVTKFGETGKEYELDGTYDVFKIVINEIDPAAIWQFGVSIAPLNYYSGTWHEKDYVAGFNGHENGGKGPNGQVPCFGLEKDNINFLNEVVKDTNKNGVPVGAGAYAASTSTGGTDPKATSRSKFNNNGIIYYERNPYFGTMGSGIENAKIKYLRYRVVDEDKIIASLLSGDIDYGEPNATPQNNTRIEQSSDTLASVTYRTNGYGYVGVNAGKVPDVNVRRIIMGVMNTADAIKYYGASLATNIHRSMSVTSWAYPNVNSFKSEISQFKKYTASDITDYLTKNGYEMKNGVLTSKTNPNETLTYTFTIAGANADHPAYTMFKDAAELLNNAGFKITVSTDANALMELTRGGLQVWAAAWSAGVDPDMYQVYHMDSNATSVLNWGYDVIKKKSSEYPFEWSTIQALSAKIEEARATDDKDERKEIYASCLDMVMDLAVELPVYQRNDLCVYNKTIIDPASLNQNYNCYNGLINNIWEVNYL